MFERDNQGHYDKNNSKIDISLNQFYKPLNCFAIVWEQTTGIRSNQFVIILVSIYI